MNNVEIRGGRRLASLALAGLLLSPLAAAAAEDKPELKVEEHTLSNGMKLLLLPRPGGEPVVAGGWVAHVGSANERPGITGMAHLFEHMMFKGSETMGSTDPKKDLEIIQKQEEVRTKMRAEESKMRAALRRGEVDDITKPESKTARYKELEKEFDALVKQQRELLKKNDFDRTYTKQGASGMNAFTNSDMTVYFITVPKNKLELWMWLESDRLYQPVFREFYSERDVVFEERRLRTESTPTGRLEEAFDEMFWHSHPYSWPVVGYPSDIPAITKAQADEFYGLFYAPNNLTACLVGDFEPKEALAMAEKYFGRIPRGKNPPPEMTTLPAKWEAEMRYHGEADTNPEVYAEWHTVGFQHKDSYPLQVLAQLLNGRTGRLYKGLVSSENATANEVQAFQQSRKYAGSFAVGGKVKDGKAPEEMEKAFYAELEKLKKDLVPARELQKVKNNFNATSYRRLSSSFPILVQLLRNDGLGDWKEMNEEPKKIDAVTAEDVRRVANAYFTKENRGVAVFTRKAAAGGAAAGGTASAKEEDPELAAIPEQNREGVKKTLGMLLSMPADQLKQIVQQLEASQDTAPADKKPGLQYVLRKVKEKLEKIEKTEKK